MLYGIFDHTTRDFTYSSAGLNVPPLVVGASGEVTELPIKGFPVCKLPGSQNVAYQDSRTSLKSGDKLLFYTDGLIEAENPDKKIYSDTRLKELLRNNWDLDAPMLVKSIADHVFQFIGDVRLRDDVTFFVMEIK
jgi:sigma-B regulation protein RsbU (phosphoserine phosphatase)